MIDKAKETAEAPKTKPPRRQVDALLGCPFCGKKPRLSKNDTLKTGVIICINKACSIQPFTQNYDHDELDKTIQSWNKRAR